LGKVDLSELTKGAARATLSAVPEKDEDPTGRQRLFSLVVAPMILGGWLLGHFLDPAIDRVATLCHIETGSFSLVALWLAAVVALGFAWVRAAKEVRR